MDDYQRALMDCPSVPRQPYCPVCGKTVALTEHHVVPRSQGGKDGPTIYLCGDGTTGCHGLAEDNRLHFRYDDEVQRWEWVLFDEATRYDLAVFSGRYAPLHIYNPYADEVPFESDDLLGELADQIRELKGSSDQVDYYLSRELAEAEARLHGDRKTLAEWCIDNLDISPRSVESYLSKRIAYASLPESCATLGITNGYRIYILSQRFPLEDVLADYHTMSRSHFGAKYGTATPPKEKHFCRECGGLHVIGGG